MKLKRGTRIKLITMVDDPTPVPPGTLGTVTEVTPVELARDDKFNQVWVDWDGPYSLPLVCPPDQFEVVTDA